MHYSVKYFLSVLFLLLHGFKYVSFKEVSQNSLHNFHWYETELVVLEQDIFVPRKKNSDLFTWISSAGSCEYFMPRLHRALVLKAWYKTLERTFLTGATGNSSCYAVLSKTLWDAAFRIAPFLSLCREKPIWPRLINTALVVRTWLWQHISTIGAVPKTHYIQLSIDQPMKVWWRACWGQIFGIEWIFLMLKVIDDAIYYLPIKLLNSYTFWNIL